VVLLVLVSALALLPASSAVPPGRAALGPSGDARISTGGPGDPYGAVPTALAYDSGRGEVFVADKDVNAVSVIDDTTNAVVATVPVGSYPDAVAYDPEQGTVFVSDGNSSAVSVINDSTDTVATNVRVGSEPMGLAFDSYLDEMFVANAGSANVSVINATSDFVTGAIPVADGPQGVAYDPLSDELFVTSDGGGGNVTVISGASDRVVAQVNVGPDPGALAYDSGRDTFFIGVPSVENATGAGNVSVLSAATRTVEGDIRVGSAPVSLTFDSGQSEIYVADAYSDSVSVISNGTDQVTENVTVPADPGGVAYDPARGEVFVTLPSANSVLVVADNSNTVVDNISLAVPGLYSVTFTETGLPSGASWSVTMNGTSTTADRPVAPPFWETNGTYIYSLTNVAFEGVEYQPTEANGSVTVSGADVAVLVTYRAAGGPGPDYPVIFYETGLPFGSSWHVSIVGQPRVNATGDNVSVSLPNGSYSFTIGNVSGYSAHPDQGNFTVHGGAVLIPVTFSRPPAPDYSVSVEESGLPAHYEWTVTLGGRSASSTNSTIALELPNGTYALSASAANYTANNATPVVVNGTAVRVAVVFSGPVYSVQFLESGLSAGAEWSVSATNLATRAVTTGASTSATLTLQLANGTYTLAATPPSGYHASLSSTEVTVGGASPPPLAVIFATSTPVGVATTPLPWGAIGLGVAVVVFATVGAVWGYSRFRYARRRAEAQEWIREFRGGSGPTEVEDPKLPR
jgi:YVTN family beta-propeller protein